MNAIEIRSKFLEYFKKNGHEVISGTSLIPENDTSVLFTTAGMHPLVPYLLGKTHPSGKRLADYQKCLRTDDIEEVGDEIHMTFFEMLGNWSLGDYFKETSIRMSYDFLTKIMGIDAERIAVTVFEGDKDAPADNESIKVWKELGIKDSNIFKSGKENNWWGPVGLTGPCGPDTEIFFDTLKPKCCDECSPACSCGKYWEVWNNVFLEYSKEEDGLYTALKQKNVDTGLGLERITAIVENKESIFETELFSNVISEIERMSGNGGSESKKSNTGIKSIRIIADHIRGSCFLIADGIIPSNVDRGYILRRLIRRCLRHMYKIKMEYHEISRLGEVTIDNLKDLYPELIINKHIIIKCLINEKEKFSKTLEKGEKQLQKVISLCKKNLLYEIDAETVFKLYDTFGFPVEITKEIAEENGMIIDFNGFSKLYLQHQEKSRMGAQKKFCGGLLEK